MTAHVLDPELAAFRNAVRNAAEPATAQLPGDVSGYGARRVAQRAERARFHPPHREAVASVEEIDLRPAGPALRARIIRPFGEAVATVVYFHGGAWTVGDLDTHQGHAQLIAARTHSVVIHVEYALAPERPFPAAPQDAIDALLAVIALQERDPTLPRGLALAGDSSGGNLAAVTALDARKRGIELRGIVLFYPATDLTRAPGDAPVVAYLGARLDEVIANPRVSPALAETLAGLPPIVIGVGDGDFLYEENLRFAERLRADGVEVRLHAFPGLDHGFLHLGAVSDAVDRAERLVLDDAAELFARSR